MTKKLSLLWNGFKGLVFPSACWHCEEEGDPLCSSCKCLLEILPPAEPLITFEGQGPVLSLIRALKSGQAPKLAKGLGGYMALQYLQNELPRPDFIVPVPQSFYRCCQVGYNPSLLLAQQIGKILEVPVVPLLKRKWQLFRQMRVARDQRYLLSKTSFAWRKNTLIQSKTILLVDDVIGTGATLRACIQRLRERSPQRVIQMAAVKECITGSLSDSYRINEL